MAASSGSLDGKRSRLLEIFSGYGRVAVAFSAGVDSTVVAKAAALACLDNAVAVTAVSSSLPDGEAAEAERLASLIGIRHRLIATGEFENPDYVRNAPDRCYVCKTELYNRLAEHLDELEADVIVNGAISTMRAITVRECRLRRSMRFAVR